MKRQIKFRAKRIDNNEWVYGHLVINKECKAHRIIENFTLIDFEGENAICSGDSGIHLVKSETIGQFIGLYDVNEKKLYEGDIVKSYFKRDFEYNAIVEDDICNPCFVLRSINYKYKGHIEYDFICCNLRTNEIIGNIHENHELLK